MRLRYTASERDEGRKVYYVLKNELRVSAGGIKRLKAAGAVTVDGEAVWMDRRLRNGETVEADLGLAEAAPDIPPERGELDVIFENEAYLAVNKPAGMLTHPSRGRYTGTLLNLAAGYLAEAAGTGAVHAVNRLDRDTSGVILLATDAHAKALATDALHAPGAEKEYLAYLWGELPEGRGVVDLPIARERAGFQKRAVRPDGKRAVTVYETLGTALVGGQRVSCARFSLKTGRTHQIRVHCAHLGCPLLGDELYGSEESRALSASLGLTAHLLHAARLSFPDPLTGVRLTLTAPVKRRDMRELDKFFENTT